MQGFVNMYVLLLRETTPNAYKNIPRKDEKTCVKKFLKSLRNRNSDGIRHEGDKKDITSGKFDNATSDKERGSPLCW